MTSPSTKESVVDEVQRIDFTGTFWFAGALIATAIPLGGLLSAGWRPADLPPGLVELWWFGAVLMVAGMAGLLWAGCPVAGFPLPVADRQKVFTIRVGVVVYGIGAVLSVVAVLLSPT